jgi:hypothetical protein
MDTDKLNSQKHYIMMRIAMPIRMLIIQIMAGLIDIRFLIHNNIERKKGVLPYANR